MTTIHHIYDKVFKKFLTLSSTAVINLINGLFDTDYPTDSHITYNWTEFENNELRRVLADTVLTINHAYSYHMEAQMTDDEDIVFRVFEYGYYHADRRRNHHINQANNIVFPQQNAQNSCELIFPEPKIIYLSSSPKIPDEYTLYLNFGTQGYFPYKVTTFKFLETSLDELNNKKLIILIPFQLLKLRSLLAKNRSPENLETLKNLIQNDIIGSIEKNLKLGNITVDDGRKLKRLTHRLYQHIYSHYEEMEVLNDMTDESLMLDIDIIEKEHEAELMQRDSLISKIQAENEVLSSQVSLLKAELEAVKAPK